MQRSAVTRKAAAVCRVKSIAIAVQCRRAVMTSWWSVQRWGPLLACAVLGVLARLALAAAHNATGAPAANAVLYTDLWSNLLGSALAGALVALPSRSSWHFAISKGFCGCFTTFSRSAVIALSVLCGSLHGTHSYEVSVALTMLACRGGCGPAILSGLYSLAASWALCLVRASLPHVCKLSSH